MGLQIEMNLWNVSATKQIYMLHKTGESLQQILKYI